MPALDRKTPEADLQRTYILRVQVGLILALTTLIILFRINFNVQGTTDFSEREQEVVEMEEIIQTEQIETPPPPPRPPVPVEVPNDEIMEDVDIDISADLDLAGPLDNPPPPPQEEEENEEDFFVVVEQMPELIGGLAELQS